MHIHNNGNEQVVIYDIPKNYAKAGHIWKYPIQNWLEAIFFFGVIFFILRVIDISILSKIIIGVMLSFFNIEIILAGVQGMTFFEFMFLILRFCFNSKKYSAVSEKGLALREKRIIQKKQKQLAMMEKDKSREQKEMRLKGRRAAHSLTPDIKEENEACEERAKSRKKIALRGK